MEELRYLIPIIALSIPLTAVVGAAIVKPIVKAITGTQKGPDPRVAQLSARLAATEERLEHVERALHRVEEAQDFHRQLAKPPGATAPTGQEPGAG
jgi:hypothetical protein